MPKNLMPGVRENMAFSLDYSSANSTYHPWPNFQCSLLQRDLKSEINILYNKLRKARDQSEIWRLKYFLKKRGGLRLASFNYLFKTDFYKGFKLCFVV